MSGTAIDQSTCIHCMCSRTTGNQPHCCKCGYEPAVTIDLPEVWTWAPGVTIIPEDTVMIHG